MFNEQTITAFVIGFMVGAVFWEFYIRIPGRKHSRNKSE